MDHGASGTLGFHTDVDNKLYGIQWGCNCVHHLGCSGRWALHCNTVVGIFGNDMRKQQYFTGADVYFADNATPTPAAGTVTETGFSMLGEFRAGVSYRPWCNWRLYAGWRAMGVSGVAVGLDQFPYEMSSFASIENINHDGAVIVHGLQAGVEWMF